MIPFIAKASSITMFPAGRAPLTIDESHCNFKAVRQALADKDFEAAVTLADVPAFVTHATAGRVQVTDAGVLYDGEVLDNYLTRQMLTFMQEGLPFDHYAKFLENLMDNPSMVSRKELYLFLEAADLPVTEDGCFLAYKAVRPDYKDCHSWTFDNRVGQVLSMPRHKVDDDRNQTCSYGFHAAAYEYAKGFLPNGGHLMVVKINPADVVSVPADYGNQKLRTCRYEVVSEIEGAADTLTGRAFVDTADYIDDEDEDDFGI